MAAHEWDVTTQDGFLACYRATLADVYRYTAMLCGHDRALAEDVVHDVYLTALARARDGSLSSLSAGWLCVAARHRHLDRVRSAQREQRRLQLVASIDDDRMWRPSAPPQLAALPERERAALVLRYVDDLSVAQVGRELAISTHAAESLLARATRRIRQQEVRDA